ncbi:NAD(P)H-binding protein [Flavobacterium sp. xlx-214]|uniref:NAD(P)H-binding protein n=1 Tax=unclassified Flavobacterium TaxID=196869 RepID=UPI0013D216E2|nr:MULTISPECIES: NAD(P)H-binding protein [unclassified Flavobacterium]MBA5791769.1 NAD(P)H-binding protein [Flavobacterium sp. xlx-221]QMI83008.1 NAD(P)H-binding protein [Flavobacterium sp. xlx-214]
MKTKVLVLGAAGAIAQHVIEFLHNYTNIELTLFARHASQLSKYASTAKIIEGDIANPELLNEAIKDQDIVYANLSGDVDKLATLISNTMTQNGIQRLIFVTCLGVYNEVAGKFGEWNNRMIGSDLVRYGKATKIIEDSKLDYTVVRPSWLTNNDEVDFETTQKGEAFIGTEVSRKAVAAYITEVIMNPTKDSKASVGVNKPGVYGDKPNFY